MPCPMVAGNHLFGLAPFILGERKAQKPVKEAETELPKPALWLGDALEWPKNSNRGRRANVWHLTMEEMFQLRGAFVSVQYKDSTST